MFHVISRIIHCGIHVHAGTHAHTHTHTHKHDMIQDDTTLYHARQPNLSTRRQTSRHSTHPCFASGMYRETLCQCNYNLLIARMRNLEISADRMVSCCPSSSVQPVIPPQMHTDNSKFMILDSGQLEIQ